MAFLLETFNNVSSGAAGAFKVWSYKQLDDTLAVIGASDYFNSIRFRLHKDDIIYAVGTDGSEALLVTSSSGATVTTTAYNSSSGSAPANATYITQTASSGLSAEQALSALGTGLVKNTTGTGVLSIGVAGTDYQAPLDGLSLSAGTVAAGDKILGQDVDDSDNLKTFTASSIAALAGGGTGGASTALDNLAAVAINTTLVSDTDATDDLGSLAVRWNNIYGTNLSSGDTASDALTISAYDVDGAASAPFFTLTSGNTPTAVLSGDVTGVTQSVSDNSTKLATTAYVDASATGLSFKDPVGSGSTANRPATYDNGTLGVGATLTNSGAQTAFVTDGVSPSVTDRVLIKDQTNGEENGIYTVTTVGTGSTNWVLTRATDFDEAAEIVPGSFILVSAGTTLAGTAWVQTADVTTVGTTPLVIEQFGSGNYAMQDLGNLTATAINTDLISDTDVTDDLGSPAIRWDNVYPARLETGDTAADTMILSGWDVDGATSVDFFTITANNTPTAVLSGAVTGNTAAPGTNDTTLSTTAYTDAAVTAAGSGYAAIALDNLASVAINTTLVSDTDVTDDLGTPALRWNNLYLARLETGDTAADTMILSGWDVDGAASVDFFTITAGNTPTAVLAGSVTGSTAAPGTNDSSLATTAYTDAAVAAASSVFATLALDNLAGVAINTSLISDTDVTDDLGSLAIRWNNLYASNLSSGDTAGDVLTISAYDVDGAASAPFITLTSNNTPTAVIASGVTGTTQSASDNSTKLATTAYTDAAVAAGGGGGGGWTQVSKVSVSGSPTQVDFENVFAGSYDTYRLEFHNLDCTTNSQGKWRLGTGATPTWQTTLYKWAFDFSGGIDQSSQSDINMTFFSVYNSRDETAAGHLMITDPESATVCANINGQVAGMVPNTNTFGIWNCGGTYTPTTAITSIRFYVTSGTINTGEFVLYGMNVT